MARGPTSGDRRCACWTPPWPRSSGARRRSPGPRSSPARRPRTPFDTWLPDETLEAFKTYLVGIKGPLTTPVGGGIRSLNVAIRQVLDLYVCLRPVRYFTGVPSPVKHPEKVDMVIFRENTEDIYAGIEWAAESPEAKKVIDFLPKEMGVKKIRFPATTGIGIKPVSREGSERLIRAAFDYAIKAQAQERHPGPQGEHHEVHRGGLPRLGLRPGQAGVRGARDRLGRLRRQAPARASLAQGLDRRHHLAAGAHPSRRVRGHRHHEPQRRLPVGRAGRPGGRHRHRTRAGTSTTSPATPCSRPPMARPPSTPTRTRSIRARSSSRA